ncbi:PRTRC system protein C [Pedobacter sp. LMG 31464]|uniref:PRTRC system protein C n=1 Tax=Pedobacter planticolens TaxID=2679964 RepID=A0A923DXA5_9SPHI|nr:PRTRC system protein C [Pedobacter planticolens]MBB2145731.1 PRTRC system protein C [Pedobacter planticolens]
MLITEILKRVFIFEVNRREIRLDDPRREFSPEEVKHFYSGSYPILTNANIEGPEIKRDEVQYRFITTLGTKG